MVLNSEPQKQTQKGALVQEQAMKGKEWLAGSDSNLRSGLIKSRSMARNGILGYPWFGSVAVSLVRITPLALRSPPSKGRSSELPDVERPALPEFEPENRFPVCSGSSSAA